MTDESLSRYIRREFLPTKESDWSQRGGGTVSWRYKARKLALEIAASELGGLPFVLLHRRDVKRWWACLRAKVDRGEWSRETANKRLTMLRTIYNHALDDEHEGLTANPTARIKKLRVDPSTLPTEHLSDEERQRLIEAARSTRPLYVAVLLAAFYGLRRASVCDLRVRDVDLTAGTLTWVTKTGQRIVRPIHSRLREALVELVCDRRPDDLLIGYRYHTLTTGFRRLVKRVGLGRRFRFHGLRHDFGTRILRTTGNLRVTQEALGHAKVSQTERYTHVLRDEVNAAILGSV